MPKLIIMRGLPASGKSTKAKEIIRSDGNAVRVNRDLLRKMLHFDKWSGVNEKKTILAARHLASLFLDKGINVIVDDTNLKDSVYESWRQLAETNGAKVETCDMKTPYEECLDNDIGRDGEVGKAVIDRMAFENGLYPIPEKPFIISDIDGTIADLSHRLQYAKGEAKDWDKFFSLVGNDAPRKEIIDKLIAHRANGEQVIFVSGRPERTREATLRWMWRNGVVEGDVEPILLMRQDHDKRPDTETKAEIHDHYLSKYPIGLIYDDRPSVIAMWREKGREVEDVGNGIDF